MRIVFSLVTFSLLFLQFNTASADGFACYYIYKSNVSNLMPALHKKLADEKKRTLLNNSGHSTWQEKLSQYRRERSQGLINKNLEDSLLAMEDSNRSLTDFLRLQYAEIIKAKFPDLFPQDFSLFTITHWRSINSRLADNLDQVLALALLSPPELIQSTDLPPFMQAKKVLVTVQGFAALSIAKMFALRQISPTGKFHELESAVLKKLDDPNLESKAALLRFIENAQLDSVEIYEHMIAGLRSSDDYEQTIYAAPLARLAKKRGLPLYAESLLLEIADSNMYALEILASANNLLSPQANQYLISKLSTIDRQSKIFFTISQYLLKHDLESKTVLKFLTVLQISPSISQDTLKQIRELKADFQARKINPSAANKQNNIVPIH